MLHLVSGNSMDEVPNRSYQASIETAGDITGEPVLSATGMEKGEYRVVQGNPSKAPRSKAELSGEPVLSATGTEEGEYRVVQGNPRKAPRSKAEGRQADFVCPGTEEGEYRVVQGNPTKASRLSRAIR